MPEITKDLVKFTQELMADAGVSDEAQKKHLEAIFSNDKVKERLTAVLTEATDGVARERGRVSAETKKAQEAQQKMNEYYADSLKLAERNQAAVTAAEQRVARYVETYGDLPGGGDPNNATARAAAVNADVIDKKTFDSRMQQTNDSVIGLSKAVLRIATKHNREFPEVELDPDAIVKIANEQGLSAEKAWEVFTAPARQAKEAARIEAEKVAYADQKLMEANTRSAVSAVVDSAPRSEFITNLKNQQTPDSALEGFRKGWNDPNAGATMAKEFGGR